MPVSQVPISHVLSQNVHLPSTLSYQHLFPSNANVKTAFATLPRPSHTVPNVAAPPPPTPRQQSHQAPADSPCPSHGSQCSNSGLESLVAMQQLQNVRPEEGKKFKGDSLQLQQFISNFETDVESIVGISDRTKLNELFKWVSGPALEQIRYLDKSLWF